MYDEIVFPGKPSQANRALSQPIPHLPLLAPVKRFRD
jgi:hypothetical protein